MPQASVLAHPDQQHPHHPPPAPATATGPAPPESPSSTPISRDPSFPHPSATLIPVSDLQSTLSIANTSTIAGAVLHLARIEAEGNTQPRPLRRTVRSWRRPSGSACACRGSCRSGIRHRMRQHLPPGRHRDQPRRSRSPAAEVRRGGLHHRHSGPPDPRPGHPRRLLRRYRPRHRQRRRRPLLLRSSTAPATPATRSTATAPSPPSISPPRFCSRQVLQTTLLPGANPVSIFPQGANTYIAEPGRNAVAQFTGQPLSPAGARIVPAFTPSTSSA